MIALADCIHMSQLIKSHRTWNSGMDWCVGSPSHGMIKYVLPDHEVVITQGNLHESPNSLFGPSTKYLNVIHSEFLLEARWRSWFRSDQEYDLAQTFHDQEVEIQLYAEVDWAGDADLFLGWLTEFKLLNSLTDTAHTL